MPRPRSLLLASGPLCTCAALLGCASPPTSRAPAPASSASPAGSSASPAASSAAPTAAPPSGHTDEPPPGAEGRPDGRSIIVAGRPVRVGARVVTWLDPDGYDAYRETCFFSARELPSSPASGCDVPRRWAERDMDDPSKIDLVVVHYDVAWTSRNCFKVLHDLRGLSCHFLLDVDGTIYQTLDLRDRARHAGGVNDRSVGIEIAHPGPLELTQGLAARYTTDPATPDAPARVRFDLGARQGDVPDFVVRPARPTPIAGAIHGRAYTMFDYTDEQYESLGRLLAALARALPAVRLDAPRDAAGAVITTTVDPATLGALGGPSGPGVVGHFHVGGHKQDPGPAFDWDRVLTSARAHLAARKGDD